MPNVLKIEATKITPEILLDKENKKFYIKGRSFPENTFEFYQPILNWLQKYSEDPLEETYFEFDLDYYNSSSTRIIYKIFLLLEKIQEKGKKVRCIWYVSKNDILGKERAEELKKMFFIPIEIMQK